MLFGNIDFSTIRIILAISMLVMASVLDIRKREINDILWIGFGGIACVMIFLSDDIWESLKTTGLSLIISPIAILVWRLGIFGGADALCLITLGALAPMASISNSQVTPITTLTNAAVLSIAPLFVNLSKNLFAIAKKEDIFKDLNESKLNKLAAIFIGYRTKNPKYGFSIEKMVGGKKMLDFGFRHAENTQFCETSNTWITPGTPYVIFITGGFVLQVFYGDIIVNLIKMIH